MEVFPGVEVSALWGRQEIHILGYLIDREHPALVAELSQVQAKRVARAQEMVSRLQTAGLAIDWEDVVAHAGGASVGRPHVAAALVDRGAASSIQDAFRRYLKRGRCGYVERQRPGAEEAVAMIRAAGGVAVVAHPALCGADRFLAELAQIGIEGVEAYHVDQTARDTERYIELAAQLGLLVTGGSDSHGPQGPTPVEIGVANVPDSCAEALREWRRAHGRPPTAAP
jgi:predicted metal-dependent phosphoesterase TrpH